MNKIPILAACLLTIAATATAVDEPTPEGLARCVVDYAVDLDASEFFETARTCTTEAGIPILEPMPASNSETTCHTTNLVCATAVASLECKQNDWWPDYTVATTGGGGTSASPLEGGSATVTGTLYSGTVYFSSSQGRINFETDIANDSCDWNDCKYSSVYGRSTARLSTTGLSATEYKSDSYCEVT